MWHILKKVPEKLRGYNDYEPIKTSLHNVVYDSLTRGEFEDAWDMFINKYQLQSNQWLLDLYEERHLWIPAFVKDVFWAGMSTTQRSEGMNAYFDGYITSKTTLKQFVEQYEHALAEKVENERNEDFRSSNSYIPCIVHSDLEMQFQSEYTITKFQEFHKEYVGQLACSYSPNTSKHVCDGIFEYEIIETISSGEENKLRRHVSFIVCFKEDSHEASCNCRLFEFRGMICRHQMMVFKQRGLERVPDKYVFKRWSKNVKRVHTKVRITYDNSFKTVEACRYDNMCNNFFEVADLARDYQERHDIVVAQCRKWKEEFSLPIAGCGSNIQPTGTRKDSCSVGDEVLLSKDSMNKDCMKILDPIVRHQKGRPAFKRKQSNVEKFGNKESGKKKESGNKKTIKSKGGKV